MEDLGFCVCVVHFLLGRFSLVFDHGLDRGERNATEKILDQ